MLILIFIFSFILFQINFIIYLKSDSKIYSLNLELKNIEKPPKLNWISKRNCDQILKIKSQLKLNMKISINIQSKK